MLNPEYLFLAILALALASAMTRCLPMFFPESLLRHSWTVYLGLTLPTAILFLLVIQCLLRREGQQIDVNVLMVGSLLVTIAIHLRWKNSLLSIACGTAIYMLLLQTNLAEHSYLRILP